MPGPGTWQPGDILTATDLNAIGAWQSYTPVLSQNGTRTATVNYAKYAQINKMCVVNVDLTCTTTGFNSVMTVSLPINMASSDVRSLGSGLFFDSSATDVVLCNVIRSSDSAVAFASESDTSITGITTTLGNGDVISFAIFYQTV